jgi:chromate reductase
LRKIMLFLNANTLVKPEIFIGSAQTKFDEQGRLTDEPTRKFIAEQMEALRRWALRINGSRQAAA